MPADPAVVAATVAKLKELSEGWQHAQTIIDQAEQNLAEWKAHQELLSQQAQQCFATATLFEFDLTAAYNSAGSIEQATPPPVETAPPKLNMTIREFILQEAEAAFPGPVHAAVLRRKLKDQYGVEVHEKTFGMTLYRLSKEKPPLMRREGRQDWFIVPDAATAEGRAVADRLF